jgi:hypothetical protein
MGKSAISCVVRAAHPHPNPKIVVGSILFTNGVYETPDGNRWNASGKLVATVSPPTASQTDLSHFPSY